MDGERHFADEVLPQFESEITRGVAWGCLRRCWKGFKIAHAMNDEEKKSLYANRIQNLERALNIPVNEFPDVDLSLGESEKILPFTCRIRD
jgi:hypothetical protein